MQHKIAYMNFGRNYRNLPPKNQASVKAMRKILASEEKAEAKELVRIESGIKLDQGGQS